MNVVGLDLSLTATGVADYSGTHTIKTGALRGMRRLADIRDLIVGLVAHNPTDLVVIEGYAFGRPAQAHHLGELGGVVRLALHEGGVPCVEIPPAKLKLYATGVGNANKGQMIEAASKRSGLDFGGDDNRCDAFWLRALALDAYGEPLCDMPAKNRTALTSVEWPALTLTTTGAA